MKKMCFVSSFVNQCLALCLSSFYSYRPRKCPARVNFISCCFPAAAPDLKMVAERSQATMPVGHRCPRSHCSVPFLSRKDSSNICFFPRACGSSLTFSVTGTPELPSFLPLLYFMICSLQHFGSLC